MGTGIEIALIAATIGSTAGSIYSSQQSVKQQKRANALQKQQQDLEQARAKRDAIRSARIAKAQAASGAEVQGVASSSAALGGQGSIQSQGNFNLSFLDQSQQLSDQASIALGKAATAQGNAQTFESIGSLAMTGYSQGWGAKKSKSAGVFKAP